MFQDQNAAPLGKVDICLAALALGARVRALFTLENRGNVELLVSDLVLTAHPQRCPKPWGGVVITELLIVAGAARAVPLPRGGSQRISA